MAELPEVLWQRGDMKLIDTLNKIRESTVYQEEKTCLKSRFILYDGNSNPLHAVHLFSENKPVSDHNEKISHCLATPFATVTAHDIVPENSKLISGQVRYRQNHKLTKIEKLASTLLLEIGPQIIMTILRLVLVLEKGNLNPHQNNVVFNSISTCLYCARSPGIKFTCDVNQL